MKKTILLSCLATAFCLLTACNWDDEFLITNEQTMGDVVDGRFLNDQGIWYDIVEQQCEGDLLAEQRAMVLCDVLANTSNSKEYSYSIRLKQFVHVDVMPILHDAPEEEAPVLVDLAWASGKYLNLRLIYLAPDTPTQEHSFSVVVEKEPTSSNPIVLHLYHNAGGEYYGAPASDWEAKDLKQHLCFVSAKIWPYYEEDASRLNTDYTVKYSWHKMAEDGKSYLTETEMLEAEGNLYR